MILLKNINTDKLQNGMIMSIAQAMGCKYKMPVMEKNKYLENGMEEVDEDKFWKEQDRIYKKYNLEFTKYMNDVFEWLYDHDYLEDRDD